jgi:hypothetical protein
MSRDRRGDRTQEVVGSSPISSTNHTNNFDAASARTEKRECRRRFQEVVVRMISMISSQFGD